MVQSYFNLALTVTTTFTYSMYVNVIVNWKLSASQSILQHFVTLIGMQTANLAERLSLQLVAQ